MQDDNDPCFNDLESGILNSSHIKAKLEEDGKLLLVKSIPVALLLLYMVI